MLKRNLFLLFSFTLFCIVSTVLCISNYNPFVATDYEFAQFYLSLFGALLGFFSILIFYIKINSLKNDKIFIYFWPSVRQGTLISLCLTLTIFLKGMGLFDLWTIIPIAIITILLEGFFQTKKPALSQKKV
ncbi:MAG: hypothetical protein WCO23_02820 [bacterium]